MLDEVYNRIKGSKIVSLDTETTGLDWRTNKICGWVFCFGPTDSESFYLPVRHETGNNFDPDKVRDLITSATKASSDKLWVGHNLAFDLSFLHAEGVKLPGRFEDTMVNAALINEFAPSFSLESCAAEAEVESKKAIEILEHIANTFGGEPTKKRMGEFWRLDAWDSMAHFYAKGDGVTTWQLWEYQQRQIDDRDLRVVHDIECRLIPVLNRMTMRGIKIHEERLMQFKDKTEKKLEEARTQLPYGMNVNSNAQLKKFFTDSGLINYPTTEKNNPSFTEEWLMKSDQGRRVVAVRKFQHAMNSFVEPLIERHLHRGRVHPKFNQLRSDSFGTITGRLSSSDPNTQQVPKRNMQIGVPYRSLFIPDEGMLWGSADYSQCEPRLLAYYSKCKVLVDGYNSNPPIDSHTAVAKAAGIDRQSGKRLNQALLTGAGRKKAAMMLDKPMDEADRIVDQYFKAMPEIQTLQYRASSVMRQRGYVRSILGRRANLERKGLEYKAVNRILQCSNADMIKLTMVRISDAFDGDETIHMLNNVHDSLDFQYHPDSRKKYDEALRIMCDFPMLSNPESNDVAAVPIEVDEDSGPNWGYASYGEDDYNKVMNDWGINA